MATRPMDRGWATPGWVLEDYRKYRLSLDDTVTGRKLTVRASNALMRAGVSAEDLPGMSEDDLLAIPAIGVKTAREIKGAFPTPPTKKWWQRIGQREA